MTVTELPPEAGFDGGEKPKQIFEVGTDHNSDGFFDGSLFDFDEGVELDRNGVLSLAFTPRQFISGERVAESIVVIGREENAALAPSSSFIAEQTRQVYNPNHFLRLGRSMRDGFGGQLQRGQVGLHTTEESAARYLEDLNEHFRSKIVLDDLPWHHKLGGFLITIAGHNRQLGAAVANLETHGHYDHGIPFQVRIFRNPKFYQALSIQANENTGQNPHLWERSRSIWSIRVQSLKHGQAITDEEIAHMHGTSLKRVRQSYRFESLPDEIKQLNMDRRLPFDGAIELDRLKKILPEDEIIDLANQFANKGLSSEKIIEEIKKLELLKNQPEDLQVIVETGELTYSHVQHLARAREFHVSEAIIREEALLAGINKTTPDQLGAIMQRHITAEVNGEQNLFHGHGGMTQAERDELIKVSHSLTVSNTLRAQGKKLMNALETLKASLDKGLLGEAVEGAPIGGNEYERLTFLIDQLIEVYVTELAEDEATQLHRRRQAISEVRQRVAGSKQDSLFA